MALAIEGHGLRKSFGARRVVDVEHIALAEGQVTGLLGPSGSGKSTLLTILGLLSPPDGGEVYLGGRRVYSGDSTARRSMAAVFQRPHLFQGTIGWNVAYGLRLRGVKGLRCRRAVARILERVGLGGWEERGVGGLSGGEAQRVALARALVVEPEVLLLDEPLSSLDPMLKAELTPVFASLVADAGLTTLYITHDQDEALAMADHMVVLREGKIVAHGPGEHLAVLPPDPWTARFFGVEPPLEGVVMGEEDGLTLLNCGGLLIRATEVHLPRGAPVAVGVRPEDVILFEPVGPLPGTSVRNRLSAKVVELAPMGPTFKVTLSAGGSRLASRVSRSALRELGLRPGSEVRVLFKATAVRVSQRSP